MTTAQVRIGAVSDALVPATLFGHNLELYQHTARDLSTDRLRNSKFRGPADPQTGLAREWCAPTANFSGINYSLCEGDGILGSAAQRIERTLIGGAGGILQPRLWVKQGEKLEVELWARALHKPVELSVGIRGASVWAQPYDARNLTIDSGTWKPYTLPLASPADDGQACFFIFLTGLGELLIDQVHLRPAGKGFIRPDVLACLGDFRVPSLRFPGGCVSTAYHWQLGIGPQYRRPVQPDPVFKHEISYEFGTDEYLAFCSEYNVRPHLTVNLGTDYPGETAEWAAYCADWFRRRGLEPPPFNWQIGNEQYGVWERSHMTAGMYVQALREVVPGIRENYPGACVLALGQSHGSTLHAGKGRPAWRETVLDGAADLIDGLALQLYSIVPPGGEIEADHARAMEDADWTATQVREAVRDVGQRGLDLQVGLSEWNLWTSASHFAPSFTEPMDMQHALFAASMFHRLARMAPRVQFANYYHLIAGMGLFEIEQDRIRRSLVADVFRIYRDCFPAPLRTLDVESPLLKEGCPMLDALAVEQAGRTRLFLVNRSLHESLPVELHGSTPTGPATVLSAQHPHDRDAATASEDVSSPLHISPLSIVCVPVAAGSD